MRVSVVIDNYNYEQFIAQAIESALAQTHDDVEVIVIDDGSRDGSMEVVRRYADRVRIHEKPNGGQASAYNLGVTLVSGELVMYLDADDWLYPGAVAALVAAWRPGVSKLQFRMDMVDDQGRPTGRRLPTDLHDRDALERVSRFGSYGSPPGSGNAYHVDYLRQVLPMDEGPWRIGADSVPILLAPAYGDIVSLAEPQGAYRVHRSADDRSLIFNNSPTGLRSEYERMQSAKVMVEAGLDRAGVARQHPLLLAPWEVRTLVLCLRFGGDALAQQIGRDHPRLWPLLLDSIRQWPSLSLARKAVLGTWVLGVAFLPMSMAFEVARLHRKRAGALVRRRPAAPAVTAGHHALIDTPSVTRRT
ncbi:glycosyl transferase family 2 [Sphaerotilus hippei]|uniref:Glycosyl transferase family 2 n=1 Tax=Sphaerotilus hippei TaxID=744406 RepID=A0A318GW17_9BURK|nr:glycosyltransferase family A protein [Sphaerotilus hippei]PXW93686.1 glycosyl transferase family 2 [Sphaerotilus hippei]